MSKGRSIRCYDYVNHPYEQVRDVLTTDALAVFHSATKVAASRAQSVAAALHLSIAGLEVAADIRIFVRHVEERPGQFHSPPTTRLELEWQAATSPHFFPLMRAELSVYPLTATETQLDLSGLYEPPLGFLGDVIDAVVGHRIAEASVHHFMTDVAAYLRSSLSARPRG
jgi:hypothetical protein